MAFQRASFLPDTFVGECGGTFRLKEGVYICDKCNSRGCTQEEQVDWCYIAKPATPPYWLLHYGAEILSSTQLATRVPLLRNEDLPMKLRLTDDKIDTTTRPDTRIKGGITGMYYRRTH